jgi:hypothetical protein
MPIELNHAGSGVAAYLLSLNTLLVLGKNGTLARHELTEIVDRSLAQLDSVDQEPSLQRMERCSRTPRAGSRAPLRSSTLAKIAKAARNECSRERELLALGNGRIRLQSK